MNTKTVEQLPKSLTPEELLDYTLEAAKYFLKDTSVTAVHNGSTTEDLAMDAVETILSSGVSPRSKTYVSETVRLTIASHYRKDKESLESQYMEAKDIREVPMLSVETLESDVILSLDAEDQELYTLFYEEGVPVASIAESFRAHPRTIYRRLEEIKDNIQDYLAA